MSDKRKRSPSPEKKPMAPGVEYKGFLLQSDRILRKFKDNKEKRLQETNYMLESAGEHVLENSGGIQHDPFNWTVQFVHTLLEVAAAVTSAVTFEGEEAEKIATLNKHAMDGLDLIGGKGIEDDCTSSEDESHGKQG